MISPGVSTYHPDLPLQLASHVTPSPAVTLVASRARSAKMPTTIPFLLSQLGGQDLVPEFKSGLPSCSETQGKALNLTGAPSCSLVTRSFQALTKGTHSGLAGYKPASLAKGVYVLEQHLSKDAANKKQVHRVGKKGNKLWNPLTKRSGRGVTSRAGFGTGVIADGRVPVLII